MLNSIKFNASQTKALCINEVKAISTAILKGDEARFENSVTQSEYVLKAHTWLKSSEGKTFMTNNSCGIKEVITSAFPSFESPSMYYHLRNLALAIQETGNLVKEWKKEVLRKKQIGEKCALSILAFIEYAKEAKLETQGEGEGEAPEVKAKAQTQISFTFKGESFNLADVSLRVTEGELKTEAAKEAINEALAFLYDLVNQSPKEAETKAKKKAKAQHKATTKAKAKALTMSDVVIEDADLVD